MSSSSPHHHQSSSQLGGSGGPTTNASDQAAAAAIRERSERSGQERCNSMMEKVAIEAYKTIPGVEFDGGAFNWDNSSTFKYVLMEIDDPVGSEGESRYLVRGLTWAEYHQDSANPSIEELEAAGLRWRILGGGRIKYNAMDKSMKIYGHSFGFPWPSGIYRHDISERVCKEELKDDVTITHSDEGY
ncbi:14 kDa phosphohistidine phosphatase [Perkinsus chesapeaki]|uniref:14 kDa phosphohistidine phosphatase n=1 Tax=Perkinsus chesapeaki TaxID=330153 RepID=A0A7J6M2Y0_PERCH|nr:14 kDa phosphohistidine phosphatase [Perkinsus chesapeaki]